MISAEIMVFRRKKSTLKRRKDSNSYMVKGILV
jgi:hypothetical protein